MRTPSRTTTLSSLATAMAAALLIPGAAGAATVTSALPSRWGTK